MAKTDFFGLGRTHKTATLEWRETVLWRVWEAQSGPVTFTAMWNPSAECWVVSDGQSRRAEGFLAEFKAMEVADSWHVNDRECLLDPNMRDSVKG